MVFDYFERNGELFTYLCGSLLGGLVVLLEIGGLVLLLYIDQKATRPRCDISNAFSASDRIHSGLCGPTNLNHYLAFFNQKIQI